MMKQNRRSGFTLIELLVVIAIIAILAAILFPVFAQARQAARGTSSQSNMRQQALGILMYTQDYDETYPMFQRWGDKSSPITIGGIPFTQWSYDIQPYIKNIQVYADPLTGTIKQATAFWPLFTQYGYDYEVLSPYSGPFGQTPWIATPATVGTIARPSEIVMMASRPSYEDIGALYWYGPSTMAGTGGADGPDCSDIAPWCWSDWAPDGNYSQLPGLEGGLYTGGNTLRKSQNGNFAFCDGHVKFMQPGQAAQGSNWFKGITSGNVHITDTKKYMWQQAP